MVNAQRGGVALFDETERLVLHNAAYQRHAGATGDMLAGRPTMPEIMQALHRAGEFLSNRDMAHLQDAMTADRRKPRVAQRERADGTIVRFASTPEPGGGFLVESDDVTDLRRAEDEARRRAAILDGVLEALPHGICVWGPDQRVALFNAAYHRLMEGAPLAVGDTLEDVIRRRAETHEYGPAEAAEVFAREMARDLSRPQVRRRQRANGTALDVRTAPLPDGGHISVVTDITELWRAEAEERRRASLLETAMASMRHGLVVYGPDRKVLATNDLAGALAGHAPGDVRPGRTLEDLVASMHARGSLGPEPEASRRRDFAIALDRSQPHRVVRETPDGRVLEIASDPTPDGGFVVTHVDITALARAQSEAERRAGILQVMLENTRHGICLLDAEGRVVAANALSATMTGLPPESMRPGRHILELRGEQLRNGEWDGMDDPREVLGERWTHPLRAPDRYIRRRANGRIIEVTTDSTPDGGFVRTYSDVTEDRRIREELERAGAAAEAASAAKSRFLATISHELRTPLSAVIGYAEALLAAPPPQEAAEYAAAVRESGQQLLALIDDILDVARAGEADTKALAMPIDAAALAAALATAMQGAAADGGITFGVDIAPDLPEVLGDERRLRRVLLALLGNAVKFTPPGGAVRLTVSVIEGCVAFRVIDSGIGIAAEDIPRAFEPFTQLDASLARRFPGSGLGLHLSRLLAEAMGATLTLESTPDEGTTATLRLPRGLSASTQTPLQETT